VGEAWTIQADLAASQQGAHHPSTPFPELSVAPTDPVPHPLAPQHLPRLSGCKSLPETHSQHANRQEQILDDDGHIMKQPANPDHRRLPSSISAVSRRPGRGSPFTTPEVLFAGGHGVDEDRRR
jgi:hypothetical protein